jgi:hypothetical protein
VVGFLSLAPSEHSLRLVEHNLYALLDAGFYERALLDAFRAPRASKHRRPPRALRLMFAKADPKRLLSAGSPMPEGEEFVLYRGTAGSGDAHRVRGLSWTSDLSRAAWFARHYTTLPNPAVYLTCAKRGAVAAYLGDREESEFILLRVLGVESVPRDHWPSFRRQRAPT